MQSYLPHFIIINNIILMTQGEVVGPDIIKSVGNIIRGLFWIGINWWYLNRKQTLAYYKQQQCEEETANNNGIQPPAQNARRR